MLQNWSAVSACQERLPPTSKTTGGSSKYSTLIRSATIRSLRRKTPFGRYTTGQPTQVSHVRVIHGFSRKNLPVLPIPRPPPAPALLLLGAFQRALLDVGRVQRLGGFRRLLRRFQRAPQARYLIVLHRKRIRERGDRLRPPFTGALGVWQTYGIVYGLSLIPI